MAIAPCHVNVLEAPLSAYQLLTTAIFDNLYQSISLWWALFATGHDFPRDLPLPGGVLA